MIERFGTERLVREGSTELVDERTSGAVWRRPAREQIGWDREGTDCDGRGPQQDPRRRLQPKDLLAARRTDDLDRERSRGLDVRDGLGRVRKLGRSQAQRGARLRLASS